MVQFYIVEIQQYATGEYGHIVHCAYDDDPVKARLKGDSKFYQVLSAAAVSELPNHAAIMFDTNGVPVMHQFYAHELPEPEPEPEEPEIDPDIGEGNGEGEGGEDSGEEPPVTGE